MRCPDCPTARTARQLVLEHDFVQHAVIALLPFLVVALAIAWVTTRLDRSDR